MSKQPHGFNENEKLLKYVTIFYAAWGKRLCVDATRHLYSAAVNKLPSISSIAHQT